MFRFSACIMCVLLTAVAFPSAPVGEARSQVQLHRHTLANGLRIVVKEDFRSPVVAPMLWYSVGSVYEHGGITGISHFLEHLMFKGSENFSEKNGSAFIAEAGGDDNAFTSRDYTAYHAKLHRDDLELFMRIEADRMANLIFREEEIESERQVVLEEKQLRYDDQPVSKLYQQTYAAAYLSSPVRQPVIGWEADIRAITVDDLKEWHRIYYSPGNAVLVVVGDVDPQEVFAMAERHFGFIGLEPVPERRRLDEAKQEGIRRVVLRDTAQLPYLFMGYKTPSLLPGSLDIEDAFALEVLSYVLYGDESSRLSRRLVRDRHIALEAWAAYDMISLYPGLFMMGGIPAEGHTVDDLAEALKAEIREIRDKGISEDELSKLKVQLHAGRVFEKDSIGSQARQIGALEIVGIPYERSLEFDRKLQEVTVSDVQRVAGKYFDDDVLTLGELIPVPPESASEG